MRLYVGKIPTIAADMLETLTENGDVEVVEEEWNEVQLDIESVLREYIRVEREVTDKAREVISQRSLDYTQLTKIKQQVAEERGFGVGDSAIDYISRQVIEALFHSHHVAEIFAEDHELRRKMRDVLRRHLNVDQELDLEVRKRIKNLQEGTSAWEIEYRKVMEDLRRAKKLEE